MTVENISIDVKTNANKAARHTDSLAASLEKVAKAANVTNAEKAVDSIGSAAQRAKKNTEPLSAELQRAIENATKYDVLVHKAAAAELKMNKAFKTGNEDSAWGARERMINSELQAEREKMKELSENWRQGVSPDLRGIIQAANEVDVLKAKLESLKTSMQEAFAAGNVEGAYAIQGKILSTERQIERAEEAARKNGEEAQDAAPKVSGLATAIQKLVGAFKNLSTHGNKASSAVGSVGGSAKHSTGFLEKMWNSIKRIALYRALRTFIKGLTKAFQDGLKQAYHFSQSVGGALAQALDQMSSASGQMKNQMGAAFGELLQTIMPIIEAIIAAITRLMQALSALFAALGGRATFLVADKAADSWDKASGAAKKYKNTILGFDEINRLNDEQGGGGGGSSDFGGGFTEAGLPDWAEKIRKAIEDGDWKGAGEALADHLNKLIDEWDAYEAGRKLGEKINRVIEFAFGFLKNFDFGNLGKKVAEFFNGIFDTVNWDMLGRTLVRAITGIIDFLIGFIENIDLGSIGKAISDFLIGAFDEATMWLGEHDWGKTAKKISENIHGFFTKVDWKSITSAISKFISTTFNSLSEFVDNVDWIQLADDFYNTLKNTLEGIDFAEIAKSVFTFLGSALAAAVKFVSSFISDVVNDIANYFKQFIEDENNDGMFGGGEIIKGVFKGIVEALKNVGTWIYENIVKPFVDAFERAFGIQSPSKVMESSGENIGLGILEGVLKPFKDIIDWIKTNLFDPFVNGFKSAFGLDGNPSTLMSLGENIVNGILNGLKSAWENVTQWFSEAWNGIKTWWDGLSLKSPKFETPDYSSITLTTAGFANGGTIPNGSGTLFVAGEAGAEVVTQMGNQTGVTNVKQMGEAVAYGNSEVVSAVYAMANMIVKAVDSKDVDVVLDGQSMADKLYRYNQQAANRYGVAMVT